MRFPPVTLHGLALSAAAVLALSLGAASTSRAQYTWTGATSTNVATPTNYSGGSAPSFSAANTLGVWTQEGSANQFTYTATQGVTTFGSGGGTGSNALSFIGSFANSTANVTGGSLTFAGSFNGAGYGDTDGLWIGYTAGTISTLNVTGGSVSVTNGTVFGGAPGGGGTAAFGNLNISNATYTTGTWSSYFGFGTVFYCSGKVTLGNGGTFIGLANVANPFFFNNSTVGNANTSTDFINFTTGSTGTLSLNLTSAGSSYLSNMVTGGYVQINGITDTNLSDYRINTSTLSSSTLTLAVPEPSTWVSGALGVAICLVVWRRRPVRARR